jgi:RNA polymerase sigma factor (sigma-70 family)
VDVSGTVATVDLTGRSDARLVALVRAGEDQAFEELYRRYEHAIRRFITGRVGDSARAEELTQEAFFSALRGVRASNSAIAWRPWLYEIARNATIDFHRRRGNSAELAVEHSELMHLLDNSRLVAARTPDAELDAKERFAHLRGALDELPRNHHEVLVMREFEGRSYDEIAERLSLSHAAVESKLFRARRRLEREFEELSSGRRCLAVRATFGLIAEGVEAQTERRPLARHARRCAPCRRYARELGVDPFERRHGQSRLRALLPLGWLLPRAVAASPGGDTLVASNGGLIGAGAGRMVALVATGAIAWAGGFSMGGEAVPRTPAPAPNARVAPHFSSGALDTRVRGRTAFVNEARPTHFWSGRARHTSRTNVSSRSPAPSSPERPAPVGARTLSPDPPAQPGTVPLRRAPSPGVDVAQVKEPPVEALGKVVDRAALEPQQVAARLPALEAVTRVPHE